MKCQQNNGTGMGTDAEDDGDREPFVPTTIGVIFAMFFRNSASSDMDQHLKLIREQQFCPMISSVGHFRSFWDITSLFAVLYCTFSVPYDMCFEPPKSNASSIVDMVVEAFFLIEICLNFFTTYIDSDDGEEVKHPLFIATTYVKAWLPIDIISSIPSEMVTRIVAAQSDGDGDSNLAVLSQLRIIR